MQSSKKIFKNKLPTYDNAPVVEVVLSAQFTDIANLKSADVTRLWDAFGGKKTYPKNEEHPPLPKLSSQMGGISFLSTVGPFPSRQWFVSEDESSLIQFQKDRLSCNWRKVEGKDYPRYEQVIGKFQETYQKLLNFTEAESWQPPRLEQFELGYINIIPFSDFSDNDDLSHLGDIFCDLEWKQGKNISQAPNRINLQWQFPKPEILAIGHVHIMTVQNVQDSKPAIRFGLNVVGNASGQSPDSMKKWFDEAREWIVLTFDDMVTEKMKKHWKRSA